ncbi:GDSL-type esterase/lipase family protein [Streptomyces sp. NBC_01198]|uniref:GDSL-type esterase/lipase family protein n=1 Tax=Streptomyces sp. NBC_01198 TaxID=2903769 RepID=UPI002E1270B1|nr:GDSL-type esterase/lipase family protein [Streptomyces sp. NBC_01198]
MSDAWSTAVLAALAEPDETLQFLPPPRAFSAQTVRQAVRLRRGGAALRVTLSNEFGRGPLVLDAVAVSTSDTTSVLPALRLGGARWEIPAGESAVSDPIPLTVAAGEELVVSCFTSGSTEPATYLHSAQRTAEVAPGNQVDRPELTESARCASLFWISQVLVDAPATGPVIVAFGDSITRGDCTTPDRDQRYPDHLQRRLLAAGVDRAVVLNAGIGGNRVLRSPVGPSMTDRFVRDVLGVAEATHVVIMGGLNDIALSPRPDAKELTEGLFALADRAQQRGIRPALGTLTPFGGSSYPAFLAEGNEDVRQAVNHAILSQQDWPVVDFAAAVADRGDPGRLAAAFDSGDGVHPGDDGARTLADAVDLALFT